MAEKKIDAGAIQIEDPLDFLSPAEKKEYIRAHQDTLLRSEEEMERIREATESAAQSDDTYEVEDLYGEEADDEEDSYPAEKPYIYQDTRLHTDERRMRTVRAPKPAKPQGRARPARAGAARTAQAAVALADDEVEDTAFDYMLSVAMKAFLAAILIVALVMAYMIYVRPLVRRATGLSRQAVETQEDGEPEDSLPDGTRPVAETEGEKVVTTTQLNLRTAPNTETSEVITTIPEGHSLTRLSDDGEWSKVLFNGQELYCASAYLQAE